MRAVAKHEAAVSTPTAQAACLMHEAVPLGAHDLSAGKAGPSRGFINAATGSPIRGAQLRVLGAGVSPS